MMQKKKGQSKKNTSSAENLLIKSRASLKELKLNAIASRTIQKNKAKKLGCLTGKKRSLQ